MSGKGGRPRNESGKAKTKHVRISEDIAEKLGWIVRALGKDWNTNRIIDPMIRDGVDALFAENREAIETLQRAAKRAEGQKKPPA